MIPNITFSSHPPASRLDARINLFVDEFAELWQNCTKCTPRLTPMTGGLQRRIRERYLKDFLIKCQNFVNQRDRVQLNPEKQDDIFDAVRLFMEKAISLDNAQLDLLLSDDFRKSTQEFVAFAHHFDPTLSPANLFQACRNVWIMNGLQLLLGLKIAFTPAIGAYSLLYPYTDNFLDDAAISLVEKVRFNRRFAARLAGEPIIARHGVEEAVCALVERIEEPFPRPLYPEIYDSLLAIHKAQSDSIRLIHAATQPTYKEVLAISLAKGGTSVVADGYLVAGKLTQAQERFLFGYGAYLQFLDDLQDVAEDSKVGQRTLFTIVPRTQNLDAVAEQTLVFGEKVIDLYCENHGKRAAAYLVIMRRCISLMLIEAICFAQAHFSASFTKKMEKYSPFRFNVLHKLKRQHAPYYQSMFGKIV